MEVKKKLDVKKWAGSENKSLKWKKKVLVVEVKQF